MFCSKCGTKLIDGAKFCNKCGTPVSAGLPSSPTNYQQQVPQAAPAMELARQQPLAQQTPAALPVIQKPEMKSAASARTERKLPSISLPKPSPLVVGGVAIALVGVLFLILVKTGALSFDGGASPSQAHSSNVDLTFLQFPISLIGIAFFAYCAFKESSTTGLYKTFGVYGRFKAYLFTDLLFVSIATLVGLVLLPFGGLSMVGDNVFLTLITGICCLAGAVLIYLTTLAKCPDMLKSNLLWSMVVTGSGVSMKICVFFLGFVWRVFGPREMVDEHGRTVYVYHGDVYDGSGNQVGVLDPNDGDSYIRF